MEWQQDALKALEIVPVFVRKMAKMAVENAAKEKGVDNITPDLVNEVKEKYFSLDKGREDKEITKIAIVRCETVSEVCPGTACFKAFNNRKLNFADYGQDVEIVAFFTCGGCSGRRVDRLVDKLLDYGVDVIHMSSCMVSGGEHPKCPFKNKIKQSIAGKGVKVVEGTHH